MWSDGLPRAADPKRVPFGDHRAMSALIAHQQLSLDDLLARLAAEARAWASDSFRGDVSILGLRATG
jgi:serine phosphatase RsbU (regulator of sigma subunit)